MSELDPAQTAPAPAAPAFDAEAFKAELTAQLSSQFTSQMDERVKGFQRLLNERDEQIRQLQAASLSEEEQEQLAIREQEERAQALEAENWLLRKAQENSKAAELFQKLLGYEDPEEQWKFVADIASRMSEAPSSPAPEPEAQVPDVDPNNPPAVGFGTEHIVLPDGRTLTNEIADQILKGMDHWPTR